MAEFQRVNIGTYNKWNDLSVRGKKVNIEISAQDAPILRLDANGFPTGGTTTESVNWTVQGGNPGPVSMRLRKSQVGNDPRNPAAVRRNTSDLVHGLGHIQGELVGNNTEDAANAYERAEYGSRL